MRRFPDLTVPEFKIFKKLDTPQKVQNYLDTFPINFEENGQTNFSPLHTIRNGTMHCVEGAVLASAIFWHHGEKPLLLNLQTTDDDLGHVVALFKKDGYWGAVSKTNHAVLRYRDPVYRTLGELAMSYFNEYFLDSGKKTMQGYSVPFSLLRYGTKWLTTEEPLWNIVLPLMESPHYPVVDRRMARTLRKADLLEIEAGKLTEWKPSKHS